MHSVYTGKIFAQFKTMRRKQNLASALGIQKKIGGNHAFFRENEAWIWKRTPYIALYFKAFYKYCWLIIFEKCVVTPNFLFGFQ